MFTRDMITLNNHALSSVIKIDHITSEQVLHFCYYISFLGDQKQKKIVNLIITLVNHKITLVNLKITLANHTITLVNIIIL